MADFIDTSELDALTADLLKSAAASVPAVRPGVQQAAKQLRDTWRANTPAGAAVSSITYDTRNTVSGAEAEVGPDKNLPGGWRVHFTEFGTPRQAPSGGLEIALAEADRDLERAIQVIAGRLL